MTAYRLLDEQAVCLHRTTGSAFWPTHDEFRVAARGLMEALGIDLPRSRVVLIKPNLCINRLSPDCGINTHVGFVHGLVEYFRLRGHRVLVAEGGASYDATPDQAYGSMDESWQRSGYRAMAQATGCRLVSLNVSGFVDWPCVRGVHVARFRVATPLVAGRPYVINAATLKTHGLARMTLCIKNLQGIIEPNWDPAKFREGDRQFCRFDLLGPCPKGVSWRDHYARWHTAREALLARRLTDLLSCFRADLNLIEGVIGREGSGFTTGWNLPTRVVIAGRNPVAVDTVGAWIARHVPDRLAYLRLAQLRGLGEARLDRLHLWETYDGEIRPCRDPDAYVSPWPFRVFPAGSGVPPYPDVPQPDLAEILDRPAA